MATAKTEKKATDEQVVMQFNDAQKAALAAMQSDLTFHQKRVLARQEIGELKIVKSAEGQTGNQKYKYATLDVILKHCMPVLNKWGLILDHKTEPYEEMGEAGWILVTTTLTDGSADKKTSKLSFPPQPDAKTMGKYRTYCVRYNTNSVLGLSLEKDEDGAGTNGKPTGSKVDDSIPPGDHEVSPISVKLLRETPNWTLWVVNTDAGSFKTFSEEVSSLADAAVTSREKIKIRIDATPKGNNCSQAREI